MFLSIEILKSVDHHRRIQLSLLMQNEHHWCQTLGTMIFALIIELDKGICKCGGSWERTDIKRRSKYCIGSES